MAYGRTFLNLVNDVLRELREPTVSTWNENDYSTLVGGWINACKREAENIWRWTALRRTFEINTTEDVVTYSLTGTDERVQVLDAWNETEETELTKTTWQYMNSLFFGDQTPQEGPAELWVPNGVNTSTGAYQVDIWPVPTAAAQVLQFNVYAPQLDLDEDADVMVVPHRAVVEGALARAKHERGEDGGVSKAEQEDFMRRALADSIAIDANQHVEDLQWDPR